MVQNRAAFDKTWSSLSINFGATTIFALYQRFAQDNHFFKNARLC